MSELAKGDDADPEQVKQTTYKPLKVMASEKSGSCSKCALASLAAFFGVLALVFLAVAVWAVVTREPEKTQPDVVYINVSSPTYLRQKFPGYFRTPEEIEWFKINETTASVPVTDNTTTASGKCDVYCFSKGESGVPNKRKRSAGGGPIIHGCCETTTSYAFPTSLGNWANPSVMRKMVQISGAQQVFKTETCKNILGCTGCTCIQDHKYFAAVYEKEAGTYTNADDKYAIDWFKLPSCCRCRNVL